MEETPNSQLIHIQSWSSDGDVSHTGRYKVTDSNYEWISSELFAYSQMFIAIPFVPIYCFFVYWLGHALKRRYAAPEDAEEDWDLIPRRVRALLDVSLLLLFIYAFFDIKCRENFCVELTILHSILEDWICPHF